MPPRVPTTKGISAAELAELERLEPSGTATVGQRIVGRVVGALFHHFGGNGYAISVERSVARSFGVEKDALARRRGRHMVDVAIASGYAERNGQNVALTEAGRSLAERASGVLRDTPPEEEPSKQEGTG